MYSCGTLLKRSEFENHLCLLEKPYCADCFRFLGRDSFDSHKCFNIELSGYLGTYVKLEKARYEIDTQLALALEQDFDEDLEIIQEEDELIDQPQDIEE